ncbi:hypothetical protein RN001_006912 [Aquatica leii]|uniref:Carboxypeptidase Q n=1 Tax=Aquatica leii TaxID=1421715 RepID=A0AAN7QLJ9_9COLE|nr:hypothetical protein RN001_006912 [Aquatica leii]
MVHKIIIAFVIFTPLVLSTVINKVEKCNLPFSIKKEIESYKGFVTKIINSVNNQFKHSTYNHLDDFINAYGNRIAGSKNLENAIDYILRKSDLYNLENVHGEEVQVPRWVRGKESATLLYPLYKDLPMLGLGSSVGTPLEGIRAKAVVVSSFDELHKLSKILKGKIVVYNEKYSHYKETVVYRSDGASIASQYGAVATLIGSITPLSLATPHTGWQQYAENITKIPTACITKEDANLLHGMYKRGKPIYIEIKMEARTLTSAISRNIIAEIMGNKLPDKVVVVSGHIDSWDVGEGAIDDGVGAFISWNALAILKALGLTARRTIRTILWTAEEEGYIGAFAYAKAHQNETKNLDFVMESDTGIFTPLSFTYGGLPEVGCILQEILNLFTETNITNIQLSIDGGPDISKWISDGVPGAALFGNLEQYFWYHHSAADTMVAVQPDALDEVTALWAAVSFIIADLSFDMPKHLTSYEFKENDI